MRACEDSRKPGMCQGGAQILTTAESPEEESEVERAGKEGEVHLAMAEISVFSLNLRLWGCFLRLCFHLYQSSIPDILWLFLFKVS